MTEIKINSGGHVDVANTGIHHIEYFPIPWNSHLSRSDMEMQRVVVFLGEVNLYSTTTTTTILRPIFLEWYLLNNFAYS